MRSSVPSRRRATRRAATLAAVAALAVAIAGCSTTGGSGGTGAGSQPLNGITKDTVNVGFTIVDLGQLAQQLGFKQPDYGGVETQAKGIQAVVDYINKNGGMGGRQVTATIKPYLGSNDGPEAAQAQCSSYTQDLKVFAVVLDGGLQSNAVPCYAAGNTLVLDETLIAHDTAQFEKNSPYLWSPTLPEYNAFLKAQLNAMNDAKFFDGQTGVLLMPADDEVARRATSEVVEPFLKSVGVTKIQASYIDPSNPGTLGATTTAALTAGKNGKLNRVIAVGGARILPIALSDQNAANYPSKWAISTYDNPSFIERNGDSIVTELRNGMTGLGYAPPQDVDQEQPPPFPDPANPFQVKCVEIITAAGAVPPDNLRTNWKNVLQYCDAAMFLKAVLDQAPRNDSLTGQEFKEAVGKIGTSYGSSIAFGSSWGPGVYAGTNTARTLEWDASCGVEGCFTYTSENRTFGPVAAGASAPASVGATPSAPASVGSTPAASTPVPTGSIGSVPSTPASTTGQITPVPTITAYTQ